MRDPAHGLDVLVVGEVEAPAGEEAEAATAGELVREREVAAIGGLAVELDERDLDLRMSVRAAIRVGAEDVDESGRRSRGRPRGGAATPVVRAAIPAWIR